jgi:hypothetical protein
VAAWWVDPPPIARGVGGWGQCSKHSLCGWTQQLHSRVAAVSVQMFKCGGAMCTAVVWRCSMYAPCCSRACGLNAACICYGLAGAAHPQQHACLCPISLQAQAGNGGSLWTHILLVEAKF